MNGFQPGAFQTAGFQIVAAVAVQSSGGYGFGAYDRTARRRREKDEPDLAKLEAQARRRAELQRQIDALEAHLAAEQKVSRAAVRLKSQIRQHDYLPPYAAQAVARALQQETDKAFAAAGIALQRVEADEEEEFAVLISLALH